MGGGPHWKSGVRVTPDQHDSNVYEFVDSANPSTPTPIYAQTDRVAIAVGARSVVPVWRRGAFNVWGLAPSPGVMCTHSYNSGDAVPFARYKEI